ncbi:hypothetical protein Taro_041763 [Colocasia esculenta]|uniref:Uncharacterized protein n=1 Tax=Colocasia esculenta TaxID=4460 RepID=A0A843WWS3_COLES|nr:hypothetical protein [Colocasia esculenta]
MVGLPTSIDAADWRDGDPVSGFDMAGGAPVAEAEQDISPEDAAWVDSCLVKDGVNGPAGGEGRSDYQSDDAWAALTKELIDALAYSASENATATATHDEEKKKVEESSAHVNGGGEASGVDASGDELMTYEAEYAVTGEEASSPTASAYAATFYDQASPILGDSYAGEGPSAVADQFEGTAEGSTSSRSNGGLDAAAVVIGNEYREEPEAYGDGEDEFSILAGEEMGEVELTRDIFRVWELDVTEKDGDEDEENEEQFGWQLKRALEGSSAGGGTAGMPLPADNDSNATALDAEEWRTSAVALNDHENLEELIAGISDISLGRTFSSG